VAAGLAVLTGISAAAPGGPPRTPVLTAAAQLPGGTVLAAADLEVRDLVTADLPEGARSDPAELVGRTLAAPLPAGQVVTELAVVGSRSAAAPGHLLAPLRLADTGLTGLLRSGDLVDIIAADDQSAKAAVVATSVRVVAVPAVDEEDAAATPGALVLLEVDPATATELAGAAAAGPVSIAWR
jgi:pilus assembly protein CpaB